MGEGEGAEGCYCKLLLLLRAGGNAMGDQSDSELSHTAGSGSRSNRVELMVMFARLRFGFPLGRTVDEWAIKFNVNGVG